MNTSNLKIYARSAALTVEPQTNAAGDTATIGIEAARKMAGDNTYDWSNKIVIQVTGRELPTVLAVLMGYQSDCEFRYHGPARNKSYAIRHQKMGVLVTLSAPRVGTVAVPVEPIDLFALSSLVVRRLQLNQPGLSPEALLHMLGQAYSQQCVEVIHSSIKVN